MSKATGRLQSEKKELAKLKPEDKKGYTLEPLEENDNDNLFHWVAVIDGPAGTPYEGGKIKVNIYITDNYPNKAPIVSFEPPCYHTSIDPSTGQPCLDKLSKWSPSTKLYMICKSLIELLKEPKAEHGANEAAAALFANDHKQYIDLAVKWTRENAK